MDPSTTSRLTQIPLIVILALLLAYGGFKGYVHLQVSDEIERINSLARGVATIRHRGIDSTLDGSVAIEGIRIIPRGSAQVVAIERLELSGDGPMFLLRGLSELGEGRPPESLRLAVTGLRMSLDGQYAAQYSGLLHSLGRGGAGEAGLCSLGGWRSVAALREAGIEELLADMTLSYQRRDGDSVQVLASFRARGIESVSLRVVLSSVPRPEVMMAGVLPRLDELAVRYELDPGLARGRLTRCAQQQGRTLAEHVDTLFEVSDEELAASLGMVPGPGLEAALKRFLKNPQEIDIRIRPPAGMDFASLAFYQPQDALALLSPRVVVNGKPVRDLSFRASPVPTREGGSDSAPARFPAFGQGPAAPRVVAPAEETSPRSASEPRLVRMAYLETSVAELDDYLGRSVRIRTRKSDQLRVGELDSVRNGEVTVMRRVQGGKMLMHVPAEDVASAQVYRREERPAAQ